MQRVGLGGVLAGPSLLFVPKLLRRHPAADCERGALWVGRLTGVLDLPLSRRGSVDHRLRTWSEVEVEYFPDPLLTNTEHLLGLRHAQQG